MGSEGTDLAALTLVEYPVSSVSWNMMKFAEAWAWGKEKETETDAG